MNRIISEKIWNKEILDSEIIQDVESAKKIPGFDINLGNKEDNWSLLMYAVYYCRKELVEYLLLSFPCININHRSVYDSTALHSCDNVYILRLLLVKDIDVNIQNDWEETGLHKRCYWGHKACVKELLLDARADVLIRDDDGKTARDIALVNRYSEIAKIINNSGYISLLRIPNYLLCKRHRSNDN